MSSRYVPYATTPGRLLAQLTSDVVVVLWTTVWVFVGLAVHSAVSHDRRRGQAGERRRDRRLEEPELRG